MELPNTLRIKKVAENKATAKRYNDLNDLFKVLYIEELDSYLVVNEKSWVIPVFKDLAKELDTIDKRERGRLRKKAYDLNKKLPIMWKEKKTAKTCKYCGVRYQSVKFGQNMVDFAEDGTQHSSWKGKCWIHGDPDPELVKAMEERAKLPKSI